MKTKHLMTIQSLISEAISLSLLLSPVAAMAGDTATPTPSRSPSKNPSRPFLAMHSNESGTLSHPAGKMRGLTTEVMAA